jgi:beta-lactamase regulating signal transducer with metallopeptidase domain
MRSLLEIGLANAACAAVLSLLPVVVGRFCRRPALLHGLWLLVLIKLVTPPLLPLRLHVLPPPPEPRAVVAVPVAHAAVAVPAPPAREPGLVGRFLVLPTSNPDEMLLAVKIESAGAPETLSSPAPAPAPSAAAATEPAVEARAPLLEWAVIAPVALAFWVLGSLIWFSVAALKMLRFQRLLRFAHPASAELQARAAELATDLGLKNCPEVGLAPGIVPPMVWMAVCRPKIYLPGDLLASLDVKERDTLLAHELAHLRRRDHWVRWLEFIVQGLFWWYPLVLLVRRQLQAHGEEVCDALVVGLLPARSYALAIIQTLDFLAEDRSRLPATVSALGRVACMKRRLTRIINGSVTDRLGTSGRLALGTLALGLLPLLPTLAQSNVPMEQNPATDLDEIRFAQARTSADEPPDGEALTDDAEDGVPQAGDASAARAFAYSRDGKQLAVALDDGTIEIRDPAGGKLVRCLRGHGGPVNCLAYSPDGLKLATGSSDRTIRIWLCDSGELQATLKGHAHWVYALAFSPDGKMLATGGYDRTVRLWNGESGRLVATLRGHNSAVRALAFSPDGRALASAGGDRTVRLWDVSTRRVLATLSGHADTVRALAYSADGQTLASAGDDAVVRLWDARAGSLRTALAGHVGEVTTLAFAPWGQVLATGGTDRTTRLWNAVTGQRIGSLPAQRDGIVGVAFAPDSGALTTLSSDRQLSQMPLRRVSLHLAGRDPVDGAVVTLPRRLEYKARMLALEPVAVTRLSEVPGPMILMVEVLREPMSDSRREEK